MKGLDFICEYFLKCEDIAQKAFSLRLRKIPIEDSIPKTSSTVANLRYRVDNTKLPHLIMRFLLIYYFDLSFIKNVIHLNLQFGVTV